MDNGVDPRAIDTMSLADITTMFEALNVRRGKAPEISEEDEERGLSILLEAVKNDPNVRLN